MLSVVNHYPCMALTTVSLLSQHFCCYLDRCLLGLDFWATISAPYMCLVVLLEFVLHYINPGTLFLSKLNMMI